MIGEKQHFISMENGHSQEHPDIEIEISGGDNPLRWELTIETVRDEWTGEELMAGPDYDSKEVDEFIENKVWFFNTSFTLDG